jgi:hypothetical protein
VGNRPERGNQSHRSLLRRCVVYAVKSAREFVRVEGGTVGMAVYGVV